MENESGQSNTPNEQQVFRAEQQDLRQKGEREKSPQETIRDAEIKERVDTSVNTTADLEVVKIYNKSGEFVFEGSAEQLLTFWNNKDYGTPEDIGGITDVEGKSIFRFGPGDEHGFTDRKRLPEIFNHLQQKVIEKKTRAEDQQELIRVRAGISETPLKPKQEVVSSPTPEVHPELPFDQENLFNDKIANDVLQVTKDWIRYGGNFYDHLTGKRASLEPGVDYQVRSDGTPDMQSFREARKKKVDAWLNESSNQQWLRDGDEFQRTHASEISNERELVGIRQADGTVKERERHTAPYLYENGWLYYESNYFDKSKGEMTQRDRESTKYRVYFNVDGQDVMPTFQNVIDTLAQDPEMQKHGFQIKTADVSKIGEHEISQIMNQKDRIVLYLGDKGMECALPLLQKYGEANRAKFSKEGILMSQQLLDHEGNAIPGIALTSETKGKSPDPTQSAQEYRSFSDMQAMILESTFRSIATGLQNPEVRANLRASSPNLEQRLTSIDPKTPPRDVIKLLLQDPDGEAFFLRNLKAVYPQWSKAYGMSERNIAFKQ